MGEKFARRLSEVTPPPESKHPLVDVGPDEAVPTALQLAAVFYAASRGQS